MTNDEAYDLIRAWLDATSSGNGEWHEGMSLRAYEALDVLYARAEQAAKP
jgi:hypothetical protein